MEDASVANIFEISGLAGDNFGRPETALVEVLVLRRGRLAFPTAKLLGACDSYKIPETYLDLRLGLWVRRRCRHSRLHTQPPSSDVFHPRPFVLESVILVNLPHESTGLTCS